MTNHNLAIEQKNSQIFSISQKIWVIFPVSLFLVCFFLSILIPPLQSPDESSHLERIYLLSKGQLMLETPEGSSSGGMIDSGLRNYLRAFSALSGKPDQKVSQEQLDEASNLRWSGTKEFDTPTGTGYYFPIIYLPQAVGLTLGEALGWTVDASYKTARFFVLFTSSLILAWAFKIYRPPIIVAALLVLPMSLFQFSSATIDGISTALFILAISCFSRIALDKQHAKKYLIYVLIGCVLIVTSSRAHAMPLFILVFASYFYTKDKKALATGLACTVFVLTWLLISIKLTTNITMQGAPSASAIASYYIKQPFELAKVLYRTFSDPTLQVFYRESFVGILGWLDSKLPLPTYQAIYVLITAISVLSICTKLIKHANVYRALLIACGIASIVLTFVALLIQWNSLQHPAEIIQGVQGRYLLIPALLFAYSIGTQANLKYSLIQYLNIGLLIGLFIFSTYATSSLLISRYFLGDEPQKLAAVKVFPSTPLSTSEPISLRFDKAHLKEPATLRSISIQFATYIRVNKGVANVVFSTDDGKSLSFNFDLASLDDNQYKTFALDNQPYSSGLIHAESGGGVSVWQAENESGSVVSCMIYEYSNGAKQYTKGCQRP